MATYYWGPISGSGNGTWSSTSTTNWYSDLARTTLANAAPTSADDVVFDTSSNVNAYTVTVGTGAVCRNIDAYHPSSGQFLTISATTSSTTPTIYGNLAFGGNITITGASGWNFLSIAGGPINKTIDFGGITALNALTFSNAASTWTFVGNNAYNGTITITTGNVNLGNGFSHSFNGFSSSNTNSRGVNFGNCIVSFRTGGSWWNTATTTSLTFQAGTSHIITNDPASTQIMTVATIGPSITFNNVSIMTAYSTIIGNVRFNDLNFAPATEGYAFFNGNITVDNVLNFNGNAANKQFRKSVISIGAKVANSSTISANSVANLHNLDFENIQAVGNSVPWAGTYLGNGGGNANITFDAPQTYYWNAPAGGNIYSNSYATISGGSVSANNFPLAQDTVIFDNTGLNANANVFLGRQGLTLPTLDFSSRTNLAYFFVNTNISNNTYRIYGNLTLGANTYLGHPGGPNYSTIFEFRGDADQYVNAPTWGNGPYGYTIDKNTHSSVRLLDNFGGFWNNPSSNEITHKSGNIVTNGYNLYAASYNATAVANVAFDWKHLDATAGGEIFLLSSTVGTIFFNTSTSNFRIWGDPWFTANGVTNSRRSISPSDNANPFPARWPRIRVTNGSVGALVQIGTNIAYLSDLDTRGFPGNLEINNTRITGNLTLSAGHTVPPFNNGGDPITFLSDGYGITRTIDTANIRFNKHMVFSGGNWQFANNLTISSNVGVVNFQFSTGNVNLNGNDIFVSNLSIATGTGRRSLFLGSGNVILYGGTGNIWTVGATLTNLTFGANTSTIIIANTGSTAKGFVGGSLTYSNVRIGT